MEPKNTIIRRDNGQNHELKKQSISYSESHGFKKEVEIQLKEYLKRLSPEIEMPVSARSINASSGLDVDIHITIKGKGLFANRGAIWVECKWKDNSPVRESDIQKLVINAQDAFRYVTELGGYYYDTLIMVSNQDFVVCPPKSSPVLMLDWN